MNEERKPQDYDWVTARSTCSAAIVFEKLRAQAKKNVETRNAMLPKINRYVFAFSDNGSTSFSVVVTGHDIHGSTRFHLHNEEITISSGDAALYELSPTICDDGECRLKSNGQEYDLWQILKMALENVLFKTY